ncbi:NAD(P)-dependent dehydrogenase (short-subunit alcohol dehydrogenase family) [Inhella inkyongensis]|uniref:NAD(P)-dependent dehydrogenase (Short-subunit alcohol dehydrogenase family) n=1 Tax=Inhella inkyongensis TaxID=392593 RepID=A0A840S0K6_9BURK|nr:SDR family NAD(P)-dependent oxidoreductase [Inhella inkyongensis]MBB5203042.1 NAD(P)-dependent dehydrogenase (short-subunit alcohol dehydrogenase family) [Inhella inkyongensis]
MKLYIVTGASRGLGAALVRQLLGPQHQVLGMARHHNLALARAGEESWTADLADPLPVAQRLQQWLSGMHAERFDEVVLINNAGVVTEPGPITAVPLAQLSGALRVGLEATLLLSAAFLNGTRSWRAERKILNISSGLGRRAMAAAAPYCAAKAGMDHLSRAMALDEAQQPRPARIVSLAPGIIDTDMQVQLRGADPAQFPDQPRFAAFKAEGALDSPEDAAAKVLRFLNRPDFGAEAVADVREA